MGYDVKTAWWRTVSVLFVLGYFASLVVIGIHSRYLQIGVSPFLPKEEQRKARKKHTMRAKRISGDSLLLRLSEMGSFFGFFTHMTAHMIIRIAQIAPLLPNKNAACVGLVQVISYSYYIGKASLYSLFVLRAVAAFKGTANLAFSDEYVRNSLIFSYV